jgi:hypothetical protein
MAFNFTDKEVDILKNFSLTNPSMVISKDQFKVMSNSKSVVAKYTFEKEYDFEDFGVYDVPNFLSAIDALTKPSIEVNEKYLIIQDGNSKFKYLTTATDLLPKVPNVNEDKIKEALELDFDLSNEKLNMILKTANILKSENVFFETDKKRVRITVANKLEASDNSFEIMIEDGIRKNALTKPVKLNVTEFKLYPGDYKVKIAKKISFWESLVGELKYYIGVKAIED